MADTTRIMLSIPDDLEIVSVCGPHDIFLKHINMLCDACVVVRGRQISISGCTQDVLDIQALFERLFERIRKKGTLEQRDIEIQWQKRMQPAATESFSHKHTTGFLKNIQPKTQGQKEYLDAIDQHTITFGIGPAGTGKTYLACAMALEQLRQEKVSRIVLTRPVVEAGESLGYLPGTFEEKLDPYMRPLYDALCDVSEPEYIQTLVERSVIEIAPLAFMRGRTFNNACVILDEAQNTTIEQMKMFLTRLGFSSKFIITGDITQKDTACTSGLADAQRILHDIDDIAFCRFEQKDIVRHTLVAKIVQAYESKRVDA